MPAATQTLADADFVVFRWAKSLSLGPATGRVSFGPPAEAKLPFISMFRVSGPPDPYLPVERGRYQFNVHGRDIRECALVSGALRDALRNVPPNTVVTGAGVIDMATIVSGPFWSPDGHVPRQIIDTQIVIRPL